MEEGPGSSSSSAAGGSAFAEGPDADMGTPTFNLDDLRRVIQEQELAEQTESESLIQKMNANPWFIYDQGVTRLKWPAPPLPNCLIVSEKNSKLLIFSSNGR